MHESNIVITSRDMYGETSRVSGEKVSEVFAFVLLVLANISVASVHECAHVYL